ncbi:MAG: hypothetical protein ACFB2W_28995 [Leptolyngbyaceae cyanobacterium]
MNNVQHDALLEQALDLRSARTLCRDGWSCEQINSVLKNTAISFEDFETMQAQSRELDNLQKEFGPPMDSLRTEHAEPSQSEIDFLNRGPDAAAAVLQEKGWSGYEISLVIKDSMFLDLDEPQLARQSAYYSQTGVQVPAAFSTYPRNGYALGQPGGVTAVPVAAVPRGQLRQRSSRSSLSRDAFALTFMAALALVLIFTLL